MSTEADHLPPPWRPARRSLGRFLRHPLTWLVAAECVLMLALFAVAWHVWQSHAGPPPAAVAELPPAATTPAVDPSPAPTSRSPAAARPTPHPGLSIDPGVWIAELDIINNDQSAWNRAEWRLLQAAMHAIRDYMERVVLPAVRRAQGVALNSS